MSDFSQDVNQIHKRYTRKYEDRATAVLGKYSERYPEVLHAVNRYLENNTSIATVQTLCKRTLNRTGIIPDLVGLNMDDQLVLLLENKRIGVMRAEQQDNYTRYLSRSGPNVLLILVPQKERHRLTKTLCRRHSVPYTRPMEHGDNFTTSASYRIGDTTVIIVAWENFLVAIETMLDPDQQRYTEQ